MNVFSGEGVSIGVTCERFTMRFFDCLVDSGPQPPIFGIATIDRISDHVGKVDALLWQIRLPHWHLLIGHMLDHGYTALICQTPPVGQVPRAKKITSGDLAGLWRVDLEDAARQMSIKRSPVVISTTMQGVDEC